jgi:ring-1,2-phenylacetyl-CoA epoxidase subunit PaaB
MSDAERKDWPLWEVFVRSAHGLAHKHVGSLHAADAEMALQNARDVYTRRGEGASLWIVRASDIVATQPDDRAALFSAAEDKPYRHPTHYIVPEGVKNL